MMYAASITKMAFSYALKMCAGAWEYALWRVAPGTFKV
jgi:hypothetical protein